MHLAHNFFKILQHTPKSRLPQNSIGFIAPQHDLAFFLFVSYRAHIRLSGIFRRKFSQSWNYGGWSDAQRFAEMFAEFSDLLFTGGDMKGKTI